MAGTLSTLSTVFFICALLLFVLSAVFFFALNIPSVIGYLSGKNVRKSISEMRLVNEKTGVKSYDVGKINYERGKLTSQIKSDTRVDDSTYPEKEDVLKTYVSPKEPFADGAESTVLLADSDGYGSEPTELLNTGNTNNTETDVLNDNYQYQSEVESFKKNIVLLEEVMIIHTSEVIE